MLFTLYATSFVGEVVALVSQFREKTKGRVLKVGPKGRVILYGELLYTCRGMMSDFEFFMYFMDEVVTLKKL